MDFVSELADFIPIDDYLIKDDDSVDVYQSVFFSFSEFMPFLPYVFNDVHGDFVCQGKNLWTLEKSPRFVDGDFLIGYNYLQSLEGGPEKVMGNYVCSDNVLTSLEDAPNYIGGSFVCSNNKITSLVGLSDTVIEGALYIDCCDNLYSLEGFPSNLNYGFCSDYTPIDHIVENYIHYPSTVCVFNEKKVITNDGDGLWKLHYSKLIEYIEYCNANFAYYEVEIPTREDVQSVLNENGNKYILV